MKRRNFIQVGAGLSILPYIQEIGRGEEQEVYEGENSVVYLWLGGGCSHYEFTHPNMEGTEQHRSICGGIDTSIPGVQLSAGFSELAQLAEHLTVVRSFSHSTADHQHGTGFMLTGHLIPTAQGSPHPEPSIGSIVSRICGANNQRNAMPSYIRAGEIYGDGPAWLGSTFGAFDSSKTDDLTPRLELTQLNSRLELLSSLDKIHRGVESDFPALRAQAYDVLISNLKKNFDVNEEEVPVREAYGDNFIGNSLLLARRLIENGTRFINIHYGGFDLHWNIQAGMNNLCPPLDKALGAFIREIRERGLQKKVLLVIGGEFGRTPLNKGYPQNVSMDANAIVPGRDHFNRVCPLVLFGGDYEGGVIGKTNSNCTEVTENPFFPQDLALTILSHFGIKREMQLVDTSGRPRYLVSESARKIG